MKAVHPDSSTLAPHPVAALLSDEMKARVRAATFTSDRNGVSAIGVTDYRRCPLAVAAGIDMSWRSAVYRRLGLAEPQMAVESFMEWADSLYSNPADVYALLGCDQPDDADLLESFAHLAMSLTEPHGILCRCLVCADKRAEDNLKPGLIDPWDLIGARWLP